MNTPRRHTPRQIIEKLREAEVLVGGGWAIDEVAGRFGVSEATFHRWRSQYGGIKAEDARRLRELERENKDLKSLMANQCLDILMLRQLTQERYLTAESRCAAVEDLRDGFGVSERRACDVVGQPRTSQRRITSADPILGRRSADSDPVHESAPDASRGRRWSA